jgi:hypothetical protein
MINATAGNGTAALTARMLELGIRKVEFLYCLPEKTKNYAGIPLVGNKFSIGNFVLPENSSKAQINRFSDFIAVKLKREDIIIASDSEKNIVDLIQNQSNELRFVINDKKSGAAADVCISAADDGWHIRVLDGNGRLSEAAIPRSREARVFEVPL